MKNIIFFFGSFDPLHNGHISIINNAIKKGKADYLYIGINKSSNKGSLTPIKHRIAMLKLFVSGKEKIKLLNFAFDYKNLEGTYKNIFSMMKEDEKYYILIGQDQLSNLSKWYQYDLLLEKFSFIVAKRDNIPIESSYLKDNHFIFIGHKYKQISSTLIKQGKYEYTDELIAKYIIKHNLYMTTQIKSYLSDFRYNHSISVAKTALLINKKAKLGLDELLVEKAALLHDIAKEIPKKESNKLINKFYPQYINENEKVIHQYLGEYIAKEKFHIEDIEVLNAIKYHTTGRANMSLLEQLIYVSDKIEPTRSNSMTKLLNTCLNNFHLGFIEVLKINEKYLKSKNANITNKDTIECFDYYL